ncbi:MAG: hypothetical protein LBL04_11395 [Bacteroidales bacterium]|jgi:hypothetical protein|nr:hypothetical protein [Bacteroidales bacterium]
MKDDNKFTGLAIVGALVYAVIFVILIILFFSSCKTVKIEPAREIITETREVIRDSIVTLPADSSMIRALVECDSTGKARIRHLLDMFAGSRTKPPRISIDADNVLTAECDVDSMSVYLALKDRYYREDSRETAVVEVNRLYWWQYMLGGLGVLFVIIIIIKAFR